MKKININYFQYDWLFNRYPGLKQAYQWYQHNYQNYQFLKKLKLFKKYTYFNNFESQFNLFFIGAKLDDSQPLDNLIQLYAIKKGKYNTQTIIYYLKVKNFNVIENPLKEFLYNTKQEEFLKIQDIEDLR